MDESADRWRDWYDVHARALLLYARQFAGQAPEDAVQEGFVRFWRTGRHATDPVAYLYSCVRSAALDAMRSNRRAVARERDAAARRTDVVWFAAELDSTEELQRLQLAVAELPADLREVVVLKTWSELTVRQIALVLKISPNTVLVRHREALATLKAKLDTDGAWRSMEAKP